MKKKITAMLLAICCISSTWTVYADDFSSGSEDVEIEIAEDDKADAEDDVETADDTEADDDMFSDGTGSSASGGDISAMANQIVAQVEVRAREYQELKKEAKKYADAQEVARRAQEMKEETARIREEALKEAARQKEAKRVAKRQEVADFAVQFVGNPYVWGGTSLTNGADCSGFVMSVFANFGYELPRVAAAQYGASRKKDMSQIEVGDLVFYGGGISHVALYIGEGKVVHALNSNKGIVIMDYNYDTPVGIGTYME